MAVRFSNVLEMSEEDVTRLSAILEKDPLFQKLFRAQSPEFKVFSRQKFAGAQLSTTFYEIPESSAGPAASPDVEKLIENRQSLVEEIRRLGSDKYEAYFLNGDGEKTAEHAAAELGITVELARDIQKLTDQVLMNPDYFAAKLSHPGSPDIQVRYSRLAQYTAGPDGKPELVFLSPGLARGTYKIDYERLKKLRDGAALTEAERRKLQETVRTLEMINSRKNLIFRILTFLPKWQAGFFSSLDWTDLTPFSQKKAAGELSVTPAAVCRAIQERSVVAPNGQEAPLTEFFPSAKDILKKKMTGFVAGSKDKTDQQIRDAIERDFGVRLSRRSVNVYRNEILGRKKRLISK